MTRVVLITGAASGIGHALSARFRSDGFRVVGCDLARGVEALKDVCDLPLAADVTSAADMEKTVAAAVERFGRVDALIANAGIGRRARIDEADWDDISSVIEVNLFGVLHSIRAVLPVMRDQGTGRIAVVVSRNAEFCPPKLVGYNASKAAVVAVTRTLARELRDSDILVNNLIPGPTRTAMNPRGHLDPDASYPTARMLVTLPAGSPSGRTYYEEQDYPMFAQFSSDEETAAIVHADERR